MLAVSIRFVKPLWGGVVSVFGRKRHDPESAAVPTRCLIFPPPIRPGWNARHERTIKRATRTVVLVDVQVAPVLDHRGYIVNPVCREFRAGVLDHQQGGCWRSRCRDCVSADHAGWLPWSIVR